MSGRNGDARPMIRPDEELLTPREVAEIFGVTAATVAAWARVGMIVSFVRTPGGHRRYRRAEVLALRDARRPAEPNPEQGMERDAVRLYEQGWPIRRVAAEFGCSYGKMRRILVKHAVLNARGAVRPS
ncbi:MerR family DNA-binding transcriptional regulator [Actinoallomurus sp. CA-142502]|uniref:MerR family DNA-binding transcriptional regulator n=1 Tax=Actinoallomurus sp. CA-142502 TaxID=3239885 RepID=UPI003D8C1341